MVSLKLKFSLAIATLPSVVLIIGCKGEKSPSDSTADQYSIVAVGSTEQYICSDSRDLTVQLVDQFGNAVKESGEEVIFAATTGTISPIIVSTDPDGRATSVLTAPGLTVDDTEIVTATLTVNGSTVDFMVTKREDPDLVSFLGEPAFRVDTIKPGDIIEIIAPQPPIPISTRDANIIFIYRGLTEENWTGTIVDGAIVNGLCGVPAGPATCLGGETEFFIDPADYGPTTEYPGLGEKDLHQVSCSIPVTEGYIEMEVGTLSLSFFNGPVSLVYCNLVVSGTVTSDLSGISDGLLTYAITEANLAELVEAALGEDMWDIVKGMYGEPDTECDGEPAYSFWMFFTAIAVTLYEVPEE